MRLMSWVPPTASEFIYTVLLKPRPLRVAVQAVIKRMIPPTLEVEGVTLALNQDDPVLCGALTLGCYERYELEVFQSLLRRPDAIFLDVGANIGLFSAVAARLLKPEGLVISVEPDARNCAFLKRTVELNGFRNVKIVQMAVSDSVGEGSLYLCNDNKADHRIYGEGTGRPTVPVDLITVDALVRKLGLPRVDLIKIDIQGAEGLAFAGMQQTLRENRGIVVIMEFWPWGLVRSGSDPAALLAGIRSLGFEIQELDGNRKTAVYLDDDSGLLGQVLERQHANLLLTRSS